MAINSGPKIPTDNLLLTIDPNSAQSLRSYAPDQNFLAADEADMTTGIDNWDCYDGVTITPAPHTWGNNQSYSQVSVTGPRGDTVSAMLYTRFSGTTGTHGPVMWSKFPRDSIQVGKTIRVSGFVKAYAAGDVGKVVTPHFYYQYDGGAISTGTGYTLTDDWQYVSHDFTITEKSIGNGTGYFFVNVGFDAEVKMYLTEVKMTYPDDFSLTTEDAIKDPINSDVNTGFFYNGVKYNSADRPAYFELDGVDDYISFLNKADTQFLYDDSFALTAWINPDNLSQGFTHIIGKTFTNYRLAINNANITFRLDSNNVQTETTSVLSANTWQHIAGVYSASTKTSRVYLNGELIKTETDATLDWTSTANYFQIGNSAGENYYFAGKIGACLVYNRYLELEEVRNIYRATRSTYLS